MGIYGKMSVRIHYNVTGKCITVKKGKQYKVEGDFYPPSHPLFFLGMFIKTTWNKNFILILSLQQPVSRDIQVGYGSDIFV